METTNIKGNKGLANVILKLIEKNYFVFLPFADTTCVDLIVTNSKMEVKRIQIKYRSISKTGTLDIPTQTVVNGKKIEVDLNKTDIWIVYCPDNNMIYYIPISELKGKKQLSLRVEMPKQKQMSMHFAKDYESLENAWNKNGSVPNAGKGANLLNS